MPVLKNPRYERFAQELAKGAKADAAFVAAGFKSNRGNASRLNTNEEVRARVREILGVAAEETVCTIYDIARQLDEDRQFARELEAPGPAITATMGKAKVLGLISDKHEHTGKDGGPIETIERTPIERARRIAFALSRGAKAARERPASH